MKKLLLMVMGWVLLLAYNSEAQIPRAPLNIQSPNTASLGLHGEVPVSYFTGIPNIEIPIYTVKDNEIQIPVSLRYHASGVRPDMHPGWVGMGWSLDAGGVISRIVKDYPDDYYNETWGDDFLGFYRSYYLLQAANWDQIPFMLNAATDIYQSNFKDLEPDEFSFSFPGGSGKFYLDENRQWKVKCDKPVKVTFNGQFLDVPFPQLPGTAVYNTGNAPSFSGFSITDEKGVQYEFGGNTNAIEYDMSIFSQNREEWIAQAWHLTKIIHPDGNSVMLNYEKDDYVAQLGIYMSLNIGTSTVGDGGILDPTPNCSSSYYNNDVYAFTGGKLVRPSYLRSIYYSNGSLLFTRSTSTELRYNKRVYDTHYSNWNDIPNNTPGKGVAFMPYLDINGNYPACLDKLQWKKLDDIQVRDADGNIRKSFQLSYNNIATERLTLQSLTEKGKDGGTKPSYKFSYITDPAKPLPDYLANKNDHWGFFNGTTPDINNPNTYYTTYYDYRNSREDYLQVGTLNRIVYPTGGETEFTYEPNYYGKRLQFNRTDGIDPNYNTNTLAGGLRIKKISSFDARSSMPAKTSEYFYVSGYNNTLNPYQVKTLPSSGILGGQIKYYFDDYRTKVTNDDDLVYSQKLFSSQSVLPATGNSAGTHVGYSEVVEKLSDGSYTKYFFTNFDNGHLDEPVPSLQITRTAYEPATSREAERGLLYQKDDFNNNNVLVNRKETRYMALNKANEYVRSLHVRAWGVCGPGTVVAEGVANRMYTYSYLPDQEITTTYDVNGANPIVNLRYLYYNDKYRQLSVVEEADSKKNKAVTYYRYPYDVLGYTPAANASVNEITAYMVQHNQVGAPIETITTKFIDGTEKVINSNLTTYNIFSGTIKPFQSYKFIASEPVAKSGYTNYLVTGYNGNEFVNKDSRLKVAMQVSSYDARGNVQSFSQDKDVTTTHLWDYKKNYTVAEVLNADASQVAYTSFETEDLGAWTKVSGSVLSNNGNVTGLKSFSGVCTTSVARNSNYVLTLWGKAGALQTVNGQGGTVKRVVGGNILYEWKLYDPGTVTVTTDNCDELRLIPEGASIATYTYDPMNGLTTKTDWNNLSLFYEYDEFGRLRFVRNHDRNLVKKINYNYRGANSPVYYNAPYTTPSYVRVCSGEATTGTYTVPAERYSSVVSPQEANDLAKQDGDLNGYTWVQQNVSCKYASMSVDYIKEGNLPYTVTFENLVNHDVITYSFTTPSPTFGAFVHLGYVPRGRYDVTITTTSTAWHTFILGGLGQNATSTATFSNVTLNTPYQTQIIINGNQ
jgi:hypothetical protein